MLVDNFVCRRHNVYIKFLMPKPLLADEIDAIGTKRYESQSGGEREIQRTMLELLNQMDGFDSMGDVKVCPISLWALGMCIARRHGPCCHCFWQQCLNITTRLHLV